MLIRGQEKTIRMSAIKALSVLAIGFTATAITSCAHRSAIVENHTAPAPPVPFACTMEVTITVIRVDRSHGPPQAEVDGGTRDGIRLGDHFYITQGGTFIAMIEVVWVDRNRALGRIKLESTTRGLVQVGHSARLTPPTNESSGFVCGGTLM